MLAPIMIGTSWKQQPLGNDQRDKQRTESEDKENVEDIAANHVSQRDIRLSPADSLAG